jgi:hypothetical protein
MSARDKMLRVEREMDDDGVLTVRIGPATYADQARLTDEDYQQAADFNLSARWC